MKNKLFIFMIFVCLNSVNSEDLFSTGNEMAFSEDDYFNLVQSVIERYQNISPGYSYKVDNIFELNISELNFLIVPVDYDFGYRVREYLMFMVDRKNFDIIKWHSLFYEFYRNNDYEKKLAVYRDMVISKIADIIPGIRIGDAPVFLVDIDGDGELEYLIFSIDRRRGVLHINKINMEGYYQIGTHCFEIENKEELNQSPITFYYRDNKLLFDYIPTPCGDR